MVIRKKDKVAMKRLFNTVIRPLIQHAGFDLVRHRKQAYPPDFGSENIPIHEQVKSYTMTSPERIEALIMAVDYISRNRITGALVECGVWQGGSAMAMALALRRAGDVSRDLFLYDTFSGMTAPCAIDIAYNGATAQAEFCKTRTAEDASALCFSPLDEVTRNVLGTGYDETKVHFIKGKVEQTIPGNIPKEIALLRLDTDWYESTKHEMIHLFPLLKPNGVLIIDDYGHWQGARKAVDEYIAENHVRLLLNRIDYSGRIAIKT